jgi:hypothetical protein
MLVITSLLAWLAGLAGVVTAVFLHNGAILFSSFGLLFLTLLVIGLDQYFREFARQTTRARPPR